MDDPRTPTDVDVVGIAHRMHRGDWMSRTRAIPPKGPKVDLTPEQAAHPPRPVLALTLAGADGAALVVTALLASMWNWLYLLFAILVVVARSSARQYRSRLRLSALDDLPRSTGTAAAAIAVTLAAGLVAGQASDSLTPVLTAAASFFIISYAAHSLVLFVARRRRAQGKNPTRTLIVGAGRIGANLASALVAHPELGLEPVGYLDATPFGVDNDHPLLPLATELSMLGHVIHEHRVSTVVMAFGTARESQLIDLTMAAHRRGCAVMIVPRFFEMHSDGPDVERVRGIPLMRLRPDPTMRPSWWLKTAIDCFVAAATLLIVSPLLALIAAAVLIDSGRPVLFWQQRVGLDGRTFKLCKFRSMRPVAEATSQATWTIASNDARLGRVGHFLRRSSLDELPQLWNILRREMSLVGPRPERPNFVDQFTAQHDRYWARHRVPVGLTGLSQVNGLRGDTSIADRERFDNYYIANWSVWLDIKIILLTAREVLFRSGS